MGETFDGPASVRLRRRSPIPSAFVYAPLVAIPLASAGPGVSLAAVIFAAATGLGISTLLERAAAPSPKTTPARVVVGEALEVFLAEGARPALEVRRAELGGAHFVPAPRGGGTVQVQDRAARLVAEIDVPDEPTAARLLLALGVETPSPPRRFRATARTSLLRRTNIVILVALVMVACFALWRLGEERVFDAMLRAAATGTMDDPTRGLEALLFWPRVFGALALPMGLAALVFGGYPTVVIEMRGDGFVVVSRRSRRPVAFGDVVSVSSEKGRAQVALRTGECLDLTLEATTRRWFVETVEHEIGLRAARVPDALESRLAGVEEISAGTEPYRADAVPAEALWRVVEDKAASPAARAVAARTLRRTLPAEEVAPRLRVVADDVVAPSLRLELEAEELGDDEPSTPLEASRSW